LDVARNGDEGALAVLVERHRDRVERMVRLLAADPASRTKSAPGL
jgi:hypothetical protein